MDDEDAENPGAPDRERRSNFLRDIIDADLASGRQAQVVTRFPPEPNGWLHIGHAKALWINCGIARDYGGTFRLRFDDTNPLTEETSYVEGIERDVRWLGCDWDGAVRFASDYFEFMYEAACTLIRKGLAYVDDQTQEQISAGRGTVTEAGTPSPWRDRGVAENLDLFARMRAGEFADGSRVLRGKIDMAAPNMLLRDPLLYRIRHAAHHRTGDAWCIYPMYDFAHCLEDACEGVTHSFCSIEFATNRPLYDWVLENVLEGEALARRPRQYEFARLALPYTVTSKRKLLQLVNERHVSGWDDPRMPTLAGLRRRGVTPEAIRTFCDMIGVARANSMVDVGKLEHCIREDLNTRSERVMAVLDPLELVVTDWPEDQVLELDAPLWPHDVPHEGTRTLPFTRTLLVERDDFRETPPKGWHRLAPGREVRLRHAFVVRVDDVERDPATGAVVRLLCTHDPATRSGEPQGRKVRGTIHWVSATRSTPCAVRLYDRLFDAERPGEERDFLLDLNPRSLVAVTGRVEPYAASLAPGARVQFERLGYFVADAEESRPGAPVWNRVVPLRDSWARQEARADAPDEEEPAPAPTPARTPQATPASTIADERERLRAATPALAAAFERYTDAWGLAAEDADRLSGDLALVAFVDAAAAVRGQRAAVAKWAINELLRETKERSPADLPFDGAAFGALVALVENGTVTAAAGKDVLAELVAKGGDPAEIVARRGLARVGDAAELGALVDGVLAAHPDHLARFRAGQTSLEGFFMGQAMRASKGRADPALLRELLARKLGGSAAS